MTTQAAQFPGYSLRESLCFGAAASLSPSVATLLLSAISYHDIFQVSVIDEAMSYTQILFMSSSAYIAAALFSFKFRESLSPRLPIWVPIAVIGSLLFLGVFTLWNLRAEWGNSELTQFLLYASMFFIIVSAVFGSIALRLRRFVVDDIHQGLND